MRLSKRPSLRWMTFLTIGVALVFFIGVSTFVFLSNMFNILNQSELDHMQLKGNIVSSILAASTDNTQSIAREWSSMDETYAFVAGHNPDFPGNIMTEHSLIFYNFDFAVIKDTSGADLYASFNEPNHERNISAPSGFLTFLTPLADEMLKKYTMQQALSPEHKLGMDGFIFYGDAYYYICVMPILPSDEMAAPSGSFIFGRIMTPDKTNRIKGVENIPFTLLDINSPTLEGLNLSFTEDESYHFTKDLFTYYTLYNDYLGNKSIVIKIQQSRNLYKNGLFVIQLSAIVMIFVMLLLITAIVYLLDRFLLRPLGRLSADMEAITDATASINEEVYGSSLEFSNLSGSINGMLKRLMQNRLHLEQSTLSLNVLKSILNGIDAHLFVTDPHTGELLFINDRGRQEFKLQTEGLGNKCWEIFRPGSAQRCSFCVVPALLQNPGDSVIKEDFNNKTGKYYQKTDRLIPWIGGRQVHMQHAMDITPLKQTENSLKQAMAAAESASIAKSEFLSRMSHEMRTPMNAIIGMTNIAMNTADVEKKEYCLDKIGDASKHLLGVINDILDMSKIEANRFDLSVHEFDLEKMLMSIINVVSVRADEKQQNLIICIDKDVPLSVIGDELRLAQVITNLVGNAIKFTPEHGKVLLNVKKDMDDNGIFSLRIEVIDTGIGISIEQQNRLFHSFEQADGSISRKYGGTGLGLAISKKIIELMGGEIWVESELGQGSCFIFTVKLAGGAPNAVKNLNKTINKGNLRVLAVDDSPETRDYFSHMMSAFGLSCDVASDGYEAISMIKKENTMPYNMVFVDWMMPEMDGIELARHIRHITNNGVIIIMISIGEWSDIEDKAKEAGISRFIPKPLFPSIVMNVINEAMGVAPDAGTLTQADKRYDFSGHTILLAEDVEVNREILYAILEDTGLAIESVENGILATGRFKENPSKYSAILMDVNMPVMNGYEATEHIRASSAGKDIPIIAMTANVFREDIERCLQAGMNDHVGKPVEREDLMETLAKYLPSPTHKALPSTPETTAVPNNPIPSDEPDYSALLPNIDIKAGLKRLMNNKELYFTMLRNFSGRDMVDDLILHIKAQDHAKTITAAHTLRGLAANLGLVALSERTAAIEARAKSGMESTELVSSLNEALEASLASIRTLLIA